MEKVLITGGAGFIGRFVTDELLARGHQVRVLDALIPQVHGEGAGRPAALNAEAEFIQGDVRDKDAVAAALKGVDMLPDTYEITIKDLQDALAKQRVTLQPGDAVLINTGWNKLWAKDNARYVKSCPGIGVAAAEWLARLDPMLIGSDNWPVEVAPNPDPRLSLPVHQIALVVNGIHLLENLKLDDLAAKLLGFTS